MKKFNWIVALVLPCITCGIYALYMWYVIVHNLNEMARKHNANTIMGFIGVLLLSGVTCGIFPLIWMIKLARQQVSLANKLNVQLVPKTNAFLVFIAPCIPIYGYYALCENYNRLVDAHELSME
jgi:H+/Cl- antiporter ClcA